MIFNFAVDEVRLCLVRQNFTIEADSVEEAQEKAIVRFELLDETASIPVSQNTEVFLDTEGRTDGYKQLIYRAENGGQVLKDNAKGQD